MSIPSTPIAAGSGLVGAVSWFGGPHDPSDSGGTALGVKTSQPGIAVYNQATLGGWWRVVFPNGRQLVLQQTDLGPNPWTRKKVDVTYSALAAAGYTERNFPTGATVHATYLGKQRPATATGLTSSGTLGGSSMLFAGAQQQRPAMYALLFVVAVLAGAALIGIGVNRAAGGAPARAVRKSAQAAAVAAA